MFCCGKMSFLVQEGSCDLSLATRLKSLHSTLTAPSMGAGNNCLNISPTGHWPLTDHWITKSCLTGFLLPAKHDSLCWGHLRCAVPTTGGEKMCKMCCRMEKKPISEWGWPNRVPALPFAFCIAWRWLHFSGSLSQRQTLSSCSWSVCNKRVDFKISGDRTVIRPASEVVHLTDVVIPNGCDRLLFNPVKSPCSGTWAQLPQWRPFSEPLTPCCGYRGELCVMKNKSHKTHVYCICN